jgi:DNA-binding response OmpR family regulator
MTTENLDPNGKRPTILLVENINQEFLEWELTEEGYHVITVATLPEALALIQQRRPELDLVITDLSPGLDGLELAKQIKEGWVELPVIIYSAYSDPKNTKESYLADEYVVKSSDLDELKEKVKFWINYFENRHPET